MNRSRGFGLGLLALFDSAGLAAAGLASPVYLAAGLAGLAALSSVLGPVIGLHWLVLSLPFQDLGKRYRYPHPAVFRYNCSNLSFQRVLQRNPAEP